MRSRWLCCAALLAAPLVCFASPARGELFFSEYIEGSSNNKALEIYNNSTQAADLTGWTIRMYFNGSPTSGLNLALSGTIAPGDVFVVAQSSAAAAILGQADLTSGAGWFNGDDAIALTFGTMVVDSIGQIGFDPGTAWTGGSVSTLDRTLIRNSAISAGDTNAANLFDPSIEWTGAPIDTFSNLGSHTFTGAAPTGIYTHTLPEIGQTTTLDFNTFTGSGFTVSPAPGQLDSDNFSVSGLSDGPLPFGGTQAGGDFARGTSTGGETTGGIYAFTIAPGDNALGVQPSGDDFTPGSITLRLPNETTDTLDDFLLSYDVLILNDENRSNSLTASYSTDGVTFQELQTTTSPAAASLSPEFLAETFSFQLAGLGIAPGEFLYLRFAGDDVGGSGSRDEFAIDNISITATPEPAALAIWTMLGLGSVFCGCAWRRRTERRQ